MYPIRKLILPTLAEDAAVNAGIAGDPDTMEMSFEQITEAAKVKRARVRQLGSFKESGDLVPDAVVKLAFDDGMSPAKAWRTHLELTQGDVAALMGISQSAYAQLESSPKLRKSSRERIAAALGIASAQLDF